MIRLHQLPDVQHDCPYCGISLRAGGWYIPGMRNLAHLQCLSCMREFYGDLPSGHGLYYPMLLERETGKVHNSYGVSWFADWLARSYAQRTNTPIKLSTEDRKPIVKPLLLNCLDTLYGHCLLKLLNAQYYLDHRPDFDLVVLVPSFLRWLVPDGVAAIWTVDLPLSKGIEWNDGLADELRKRISAFSECWLSVGFSHPHPEDYDVERFTRVTPFPIDEWQIRMKRPTVTFIWREDRLWWFERHNKLVNLLPRTIQGMLRKQITKVERQRRLVVKLADSLRVKFPEIDFAVVGLDRSGEFPAWITDLRNSRPTASTERAWCERYASSHVVIGVHGSSMLLPSAHAGAVVELMPNERWDNILQDLLFRPNDLRETIFRCRIIPLAASISEMALIVGSILSDHGKFLINMRREFCDHGRTGQASAWVIARNQRLAKLPDLSNDIVDKR